jgi:hypothetical protein
VFEKLHHSTGRHHGMAKATHNSTNTDY